MKGKDLMHRFKHFIVWLCDMLWRNAYNEFSMLNVNLLLGGGGGGGRVVALMLKNTGIFNLKALLKIKLFSDPSF